MKDKQLVKLLPLREPIISFFNFFGSAISSEDILYAIVSLSIYIYIHIYCLVEKESIWTCIWTFSYGKEGSVQFLDSFCLVCT